MATGSTDRSNQPEGSESPEIKLRESEPLSNNPFVHLTLDPVQSSDSSGSQMSENPPQPYPVPMYQQYVPGRMSERPSRISRSFPNKPQINASQPFNGNAPMATNSSATPSASKDASPSGTASDGISSSPGPSLRVVLEHEEVKPDPAHKDKSADVQIGADHINVPSGLHTKDDLEDMAASFPMIPKSLIFEDKPRYPGNGMQASTMQSSSQSFAPGQMGAHATAPLNGAVAMQGNPRNMQSFDYGFRQLQAQQAMGPYGQPAMPVSNPHQAAMMGQQTQSGNGLNAALWSQNPAIGSLSPYNPDSIRFSNGNVSDWYGADASGSPSLSGTMAGAPLSGQFGSSPYPPNGGGSRPSLYNQQTVTSSISPGNSAPFGMRAPVSDYRNSPSQSGRLGAPLQSGANPYMRNNGQWSDSRNSYPGTPQNRYMNTSPSQNVSSAVAAGPNRAQQSHMGSASPAPTRSGISNGKPLINSAAADESSIFDQPPVPISEGMKDAESNHKRGRRWLLIVILLVVLAAAGTVGYLIWSGTIDPASIVSSGAQSDEGEGNSSENGGTSSGTSSQNENQSSGLGGSQQSDSSNSEAGSTFQSGGNAGSSSSDDAGSVVYQYTASTSDGTTYSVEETATFTEDGYCSFTTMVMSFPDAAKAKAFTDNLARDYGNSFTLDSLDGAVATVTIDNSSLHLDREEYENSLRFSVEDLVILKK